MNQKTKDFCNFYGIEDPITDAQAKELHSFLLCYENPEGLGWIGPHPKGITVNWFSLGLRNRAAIYFNGKQIASR